VTATSQSSGHLIEFDELDGWVYSDTKKPVVGNDRPCVMCGRKTVRVFVTIPADLSHTGKERLAMKRIDACIAPIVLALEMSGIHMRGSCCGHGKEDGGIVLQDGRVLVIKKGGTE